MKAKKVVEKLEIGALLKKYWGYDEFRPMQRDIINSILSGRDTLALLPTGGGKSLTYQIPALHNEGLCIVITPLIALMKDQVDRLRSLSISAVAIHSGLSPRQIDIALDNCVYGDVKFLYVSPERVASELFRLRVQRMKVSMVAVDEAHCISQWGYDFRPPYLTLSQIRQHTGNVPILALTATATPAVVDDIVDKLALRDPKILRGDFTRKNLTYVVRTIEDKETQLMKVLESVAGSGIIYVRTRASAEQLAKTLSEQGVTATYYHGGLPHTERALHQEEWLKGEVRVMVATNAFGMGIDKPDVRFVVHYTMSDSLENYYQEAGRAGRDGKRSYALLLHSSNDSSRILKRYETEFPPIERIKDIYDKICSSLQIAIGDGEMSSHIFNIYEFCAKEKYYRGMVLSAIKILDDNGYLTLTEELANPARIMFTMSRDDLYKVRVSHNDFDHLLRVILRLYEGLFSDFRPISEIEIAHWSGYNILKVKDLLTQLWRMRIIRYIPSNQSPMIYLNSERLSVADLYISPESYKFRQEQRRIHFENMLKYTTNASQCRSQFFDDYFGIEQSTPCGVCDICLDEKRQGKRENKSSIKEQLIELLGSGELSSKQITQLLDAPTEDITVLTEQLLGERVIKQLPNGKIALAK